VAAAESPKVAPETSTGSTTAVSIDKLRTEISALAEAMKNIPIIVQNQEQFAKELEKQSKRIYDISGTVETRTEAISSQMKVQSNAINRLDMRLQSVETDSRRSSIPVTPKAPSPPSMPFESTKENRESAERRTTELQELPTESEQESESMDDLLSAFASKNLKSHPNSTALESALQGSREERLRKAGLQRERTSIPIAQKEQTSIPVSSIPIVMPDPIRPIPMVVPEFADIITKPHLPDITYARGATHIKKSIERHHIHQVVVVNALTRFGTQTGIFLDLDTQRFYAEIRSKDHPQYDFGPQDQPPTPIGYNGKWFINKMDPLMWEFNGDRMRGASEQHGQDSSPRRPDSPSQRQSPTTRRRPQEPDESDPNPTDSDNRNAGRDRGRDDRGRDDRGRDRNRDRDEPHRRRTGGGRRDPSDPSDPSDPDDDDDIYGRRRSRSHQNRNDRRRGRDRYRDRSTRQPTPIVDKSTAKLSSSTLGFFDPDKDSVHSFCDQLSLMTELYDDAAIIALIPGALVGRAKSWFSSRSMP